MSRYLVLGAGSAIARAMAMEWALRESASVILAGRNLPEMERLAADIHIRYDVSTSALAFDALDYAGHAAFWQRCLETGDAVDGVILAVGSNPDQEEAEQDTGVTRQAVEVNFTACASILHTVAPYFEQRGRGTLVVLASVAGDRGRKSNYVYGSAKAGLAVFTEGLRMRLAGSGVRVITVKPGFVDTRMTFERGKLPLVASPQSVAQAVYGAVQRGRNTIYVPWFWALIMMMIRALPERIMSKMNF